MEWNTEIKVQLLQIDNEEKKRGKGFMRRVNERSDTEATYQQACKN